MINEINVLLENGESINSKQKINEMEDIAPEDLENIGVIE